MAEQKHSLSELHDQVRAEKTLIESVKAFIGGLKDRIQAALANSANAEAAQAEVDQIFAELDANHAELAGAIVENTPQAGPTGTVASQAGQVQTPGPAAGTAAATEEAPAPAGSSTVVSDAVGAAATKATTALGDVIDAVQSGGDVNAAADALKLAHAELAGVTDAEVTDQSQAAAKAVDAVAGLPPSADAQPAALAALSQAHNDLIAAASAAGSGDAGPEAPNSKIQTPTEGGDAQPS